MFYGYRVGSTRKFVGLYQCDVEDFKKFWQNFKLEIMNCVVILESESWVYCKNWSNKGFWKKFKDPKDGLAIWNDRFHWDYRKN